MGFLDAKISMQLLVDKKLCHAKGLKLVFFNFWSKMGKWVRNECFAVNLTTQQSNVHQLAVYGKPMFCMYWS